MVVGSPGAQISGQARTHTHTQISAFVCIMMHLVYEHTVYKFVKHRKIHRGMRRGCYLFTNLRGWGEQQSHFHSSVWACVVWFFKLTCGQHSLPIENIGNKTKTRRFVRCHEIPQNVIFNLSTRSRRKSKNWTDAVLTRNCHRYELLSVVIFQRATKKRNCHRYELLSVESNSYL